MPIRVALHHKTVYNYDRLVSLSPQVVRLRPAPHCRTPVTSYSLKIRPSNHFLNWQQDPQGNFLARAVVPDQTREFSVEVALVAEMPVINPFDFFLEPYADKFPFEYEPWLAKELAPFRGLAEATPLFRKYLDSIDRAPRQTMDFLVDLNQRLQRDIQYLIRLEPGVQTPEETLQLASGSCRDSAWLLVQLARHLGLAARFVSGYLIQLKADVKPLEGPAGPQEDFTDLHAWAEIYLPGAGWVGFDPTSGLSAAEGHLPLAATPEPTSAAPITGSVSKAEVEFHHEMSVMRIHEDPRVTKPYTDEQWQTIFALGERVDQELRAGDVRLTMGGEPTFVSIDDMDGAEWNTAALGEEKYGRAVDLFERMQTRFAPGALKHFGQGKWYPGESLPRWALGCYWRKDGLPIWLNDEWTAHPLRTYNYSTPDAERFARMLAARLGVNPDFARPAYEDPIHYLREEGLLPVNVTATDSRLENKEDRDRLRRLFEQGLTKVVGYLLPLRKSEGLWESGGWATRSEQIWLIPGDSPMGFRLPLRSLAWAGEEDLPADHQRDPFAPRPGLPVPAAPALGPAMQLRGISEQKVPAPFESASWIVRTALCVEARDGRIYVFMPPVRLLEDYLDLVAAIESTAAQLRTPVLIEGYTPPDDYRLEHFRVTPDPGVIEVNIHPSHSWDQLVDNTLGVYEDARNARLGTEKFMLDGRHSGTGGGNHFVIGGPTPADSPLLRRPDVLKSLLGYWNNHPSLSYLFSGLFIGPTSQSPRVDESRNDALYELEIAFAQIPGPNKRDCPPWLIDRILRHLLVDVSGNTHRAEFCIDKLYSPDTASGRLGLLELRSFEMPPHPRMSLTQQLLFRALIAWFWKQPYDKPLARWGTQLYDKFMLPHYVKHDFDDVIGDLGRAGYLFDSDWFSAHHEFRFPLFGHVNHHGISLELRGAIEPWHVLGEEPGGGGTSRYVDSSVERIQVKVENLLTERYQVTCNGRVVPLYGTGTNGEYVAGVRYRAWQPPSCLHPTIGVHSPLIFDIVDSWQNLSVGGCSYHVSHPGGRSYSTMPVNAAEAESRRVARFFALGHTPGRVEPAPISRDPQFPMTLDLRTRG